MRHAPSVLYIAGPMTGQPLWGFQAFEDASHEIARLGYRVISPHQVDIDSHRVLCTWQSDGKVGSKRTFLSVELSDTFDYEQTLATDLELIEHQCDGIVLLPGFSDSEGACRELACAESLGLHVFLYADGVLTPLEPGYAVHS